MKNLQTITENYLDYCRTQKCLDKKTLKAYQVDLRQFSEEPSLQEITETTQSNLENYIAKLHKQYKPKTIPLYTVEKFLTTIYTQRDNAKTNYQGRTALRDAAVAETLNTVIYYNKTQIFTLLFIKYCFFTSDLSCYYI